MNLGLDENQTKLLVLILSVLFQMLPHGERLFNQAVQILWKLRSKTKCSQDPDNLVSSDVLHLTNSMRISKKTTDLRRSQALPGKLADVIADFGLVDLEP